MDAIDESTVVSNVGSAPVHFDSCIGRRPSDAHWMLIIREVGFKSVHLLRSSLPKLVSSEESCCG